jgi:hypothetical protein
MSGPNPKPVGEGRPWEETGQWLLLLAALTLLPVLAAQ